MKLYILSNWIFWIPLVVLWWVSQGEVRIEGVNAHEVRRTEPGRVSPQ